MPYLEEFLFMGLFFLEVLRDWYAGVPILLAESEVIGIDEIVDLLFDGSRIEGNIVFRKELLLFIIV